MLQEAAPPTRAGASRTADHLACQHSGAFQGALTAAGGSARSVIRQRGGGGDGRAGRRHPRRRTCWPRRPGRPSDIKGDSFCTTGATHY
jgi:hypothetical protein